MKTCGECECRRASAVENGCPSYTSPDRMQPETAAACRPMTLVSELEAERDRLVKEHMDCTALKERDEARAEACAPMVALVEARARVAELEAERDCDKCICVLASNAVASFLQRAVRDLGVCPRCGKDTHRMIPSFRDQDPFPFCSEGCRFWGYGNPRRG